MKFKIISLFTKTVILKKNLVLKGTCFGFESDLNTACVFLVYKQKLQLKTTFINDLFAQAAATRPIDHN